MAWAGRILTFIGAAAALCAAGCVYRNPVSTCRMWADYNTLLEPALFFEETDHLPYHAERVSHYHWLYNARGLAEQQWGPIYPIGEMMPQQAAPGKQSPSVPAPHDLPADEPVMPHPLLPPLPAESRRPTKAFDDAAVPPRSGPAPLPKSVESEGPTAMGDHPSSTR